MPPLIGHIHLLFIEYSRLAHININSHIVVTDYRGGALCCDAGVCDFCPK